MSFEDNIQKSAIFTTKEKTFIDKLLAKEDVSAMRDLIKKDKLKRTELLELLYLLSSSESKLYNFSTWERYIILKFFVWIREFVKVAEMLYDEEDKLRKRANLCKECRKPIKAKDEINKCKCTNSKPMIVMTERTRTMFDNNSRLIEHNAKFLIDLYLNICRTSLSVGATGFIELLKNKFEMTYYTPNQNQPIVDTKNMRIPSVKT